MRSEAQWEFVGRCIHCNSPVYKMNDELKFTGKNCRCELPTSEEGDKNESRTKYTITNKKSSFSR